MPRGSPSLLRLVLWVQAFCIAPTDVELVPLQVQPTLLSMYRFTFWVDVITVLVCQDSESADQIHALGALSTSTGLARRLLDRSRRGEPA